MRIRSDCRRSKFHTSFCYPFNHFGCCADIGKLARHPRDPPWSRAGTSSFGPYRPKIQDHVLEQKIAVHFLSQREALHPLDAQTLIWDDAIPYRSGGLAETKDRLVCVASLQPSGHRCIESYFSKRTTKLRDIRETLGHNRRQSLLIPIEPTLERNFSCK